MVEGKETVDQDNARHRGAARQVLKRAVLQAMYETTVHRPIPSIERLADHVVHRLEQRDLRDCLALLTADD